MNLGTYADGRAIGYDEQTGTLDVGGTPVTPQQLRTYDDAAQVTWAAEGNRAWLDSAFPVAAAATSPKTRKTPVLAVVIGVLLLCGLVAVAGNMMPDATPSTPAPATKQAPEAPKTEAPAAVAPAEPVVEAPPAEEPVVEEPAAPQMTMGQEQAVQSAESYLEMGGFSRKKLINQLVDEEFSKADATFAVDYLKPDWNAQAAQSAQSYVEMGGFSRSKLIKQLEFEGFTTAQAKYGAKAAGY